MSDPETLEVRRPEDVTIGGETRAQRPRDQLFCIGLGAVITAASFAYWSGVLQMGGLLFGGFIAGTAFERLQWMVEGEYGGWRSALREALSGGDSE